MIFQTSVQWLRPIINQSLNSQKTLTGEIWGPFCEEFGENWPHYNGAVLYSVTICSSDNEVCDRGGYWMVKWSLVMLGDSLVCTELFWRKINIIAFCIIQKKLFFADTCSWNLPFTQNKVLDILVCALYHDRWWSGDAKSESISNNSIDLVSLAYSVTCMRRVNSCIWPLYFVIKSIFYIHHHFDFFVGIILKNWIAQSGHWILTPLSFAFKCC